MITIEKLAIHSRKERTSNQHEDNSHIGQLQNEVG